ncbi:hypothetical protein trd_1188 [Thermomicrobium roseum DSM 5159]|uniref:Uncharacterized protein n=1 Tax=Thermomicrobium roseum (strain ATCC 27502 / DSM 5159 / P-2) TaxID=309801 RepID=B9L1D0_THERP|nr:hypothetical protein trd_1188 [Thermomicrobium roseum DSM 5159]
MASKHPERRRTSVSAAIDGIGEAFGVSSRSPCSSDPR